MSAVAGLFQRDGRPLEAGTLEPMVAALAHRGPDAVGTWCEGPIGLAHGLLLTTPEGSRQRPGLVSAESRLVLSADARLDNRSELIVALGLAGRLSGEISDGELILGAYERWGDCAPERLLGDFAFAVWDSRRHVLFCARDRMGVRPFYYFASPRTFAFASEIKSLLALPVVPRRLNEARVADHLGATVADKTSTFYQDILRLPPGHCLSVGHEGLDQRRYWALDSTREVRHESDRAYAEAFRAHFVDAVRCRLRAVAPVGSTLSGGLDSSSVACVARELLQGNGDGRLHTFSAIFPGLPRADELRLINAVLRDGKVVAHHVRADVIDPLTDLHCALPDLDEPSYSTVTLLYRSLFRQAQQHGVRVLLDGLEGDTTVSHGTAYPLELARTGRWMALGTEVIAFAQMGQLSSGRLLWQTVRPLAPRWIRRLGRRLGRQEQAPGDVVLRRDLVQRTGLEERLEARREEWRKGVQTARQDHWRRIDSPLVTQAIESVGAAASAFSIEPRHPFLDSRLVEFCLALPGRQTLRRGATRVVMREAMVGVLPEEIRWRQGKADLRAVIPHALGAAGSSVLGPVLEKEAEILSAYVDVAALRATCDRFAHTGVPRYALAVWKAVTFAAWLRYRGLG